jgi:membrane protein DedA with SNARE-associated domain
MSAGTLILCFAAFTINNLIWYWVGKNAGEEIHMGRDDDPPSQGGTWGRE